ncbi:HAD family hydrolase [Lentibacillus sp. N15]|uniref:HAD family hydrolase n=1 Tax=Lentibacillus songyuanensis TaxID=3136161 RepID=UPI0031BA2E34
MAVITVDFDGTLFTGDSFKVMVKVAMKEFTTEQWKTTFKGIGKAVTVGLSKGKDTFKLQFFRAFAGGFRGESKQALNDFFQKLVKVGKHKINQELVTTVKNHQQNGDAVIVVSGAFTPFLEVFTREIGLDVPIISTQLLFDDQDICTDVGTVINGQEKVKKVQAWLEKAKQDGTITAEAAEDIWAYADSKSDIPLFEFANRPVIVNPNGTMKEIAAKKNWPVML